MCGRLFNTLSPELIAQLVSKQKVEIKGDDWVYPSYNVAPTKIMSVLCNRT